MFKKLSKVLFGDPVEEEIKELAEVAQQINAMEAEYEALTEEEIKAKTAEFRQRLKDGETLDDLLPEAFATVREASKRTLGLRHYDIQLIGGQALHNGKIIEMLTGEGKTLVATLPIYLNALEDKGIHLITVNDFLARTQARLMAQVYHYLGLSVGVLQMASRTENGRKAFLIDLNKTSSQEDQHQLVMVLRKEAYQADVTYGTNAEFGFDYLRDNLTMTLGARVQRGHHYAVIDEVDNVLIDEARTPLIISGASQQGTEHYAEVDQVVRQLRGNPEFYEINEKDNTITLTELGEARVEELLNMSLGDPERPEDITPEQARMLGFLEQSMRAHFLFKRNKDYLVQGGKVIIIDEFTGRLMPGRRWSQGLHQAVEAKESAQIEPENATFATITLQNYFRMYDKLSGMTGTAVTEEEEFDKIYSIGVLPLPSNLEYETRKADAELEIAQDKDEYGYKYTYYKLKNDPENNAVFFKRKDYTDIVYRTEEAKLRAIMQEIIQFHVMGRPILVGTTSVEHSDRLAVLLRPDNVRKLMQILSIRSAWMEANNVAMIDRIEPELQPFNRPLAEIQQRELREMARKLNISNNPSEENNLSALLEVLNLQEEHRPRLRKLVEGGVPNQVLNARKHDQEGLVIARAGAYGAVTIATNMAGRGVDIKLGGDIPENIRADVVKLLRKTGVKEVYEMTHDEMREALRQMPPEDYGIYKESAEFFLESMEGDDRVRELGGLHVIGSERHEARRIDNQLRGRAARQGDPGSSRFYLSFEDDLMRIFGGSQAEAVFARMKVDESIPMEIGLVGRLVEQSQERVEGANFDMREHLLEYDDVLNTQRVRIYDQRDRVFEKDDLTEDVVAMLQSEMEQRIPQGLEDEEGPWRLLSFLEQIQPTLAYGKTIHPSFGLSLLLDRVQEALNQNGKNFDNLKQVLLEIAEETLKTEQEHVAGSILQLTTDAVSRYKFQSEERLDNLSMFLESVEDREDIDTITGTNLLSELQELMRAPLRLTNSQTQQLHDDPEELEELLVNQVQSSLTAVGLRRLLGAVARRLGEPLDLAQSELSEKEFDDAAKEIYEKAVNQLTQRSTQLLGEKGAIARDIQDIFGKLADESFTDTGIIEYLRALSSGQRQVFDQRSHRRTSKHYVRMHYAHYGAQMIARSDVESLTRRIINHLENALSTQQKIWGELEWQQYVQGQATLEQMDGKRRTKLRAELGEEWFIAHRSLLAETYSEEDKETIESFLGQYLVNEVYRRLLLRVISDEWVEYLTKMESLRVSVRMESYAQRNPLVVYKSKAIELYHELLSDIRMQVISKMFTIRPRRETAATVARPSAARPVSAPSEKGDPGNDQTSGRRRHRRKRH
ncbi:MAG: hypothetical protein K8R40_06620 [Anaerolineaceae bacterium]|nr:hypothetical protein [Anaerolineaceae bacterium]